LRSLRCISARQTPCFRMLHLGQMLAGILRHIILFAAVPRVGSRERLGLNHRIRHLDSSFPADLTFCGMALVRVHADPGRRIDSAGGQQGRILYIYSAHWVFLIAWGFLSYSNAGDT
jgi:hypothetical protein